MAKKPEQECATPEPVVHEGEPQRRLTPAEKFAQKHNGGDAMIADFASLSRKSFVMRWATKANREQFEVDYDSAKS